MNAQEQSSPADAQIALEKYFAQIRLARATGLAQSRRFLEAEAILIRNDELPDDARELDLLARIAALQGRFGDARRLWNVAIAKGLENDVYRECLELLTPVNKIRRWIARSQDTVVVILAWLTIGAAIAALALVFRIR